MYQNMSEVARFQKLFAQIIFRKSTKFLAHQSLLTKCVAHQSLLTETYPPDRLENTGLQMDGRTPVTSGAKDCWNIL